MSGWSSMALYLAFGGCAVAITGVGVSLAKHVDVLSIRTRVGRALLGGVLLGGFTSLPGIVVSVQSAAAGLPRLAFSNAVGGIAAQTVFLAVADLAHENTNLEHAGADVGNLVNGALLLTLLGIPVLGVAVPEVSVGHVHVASPVLLAAYLGGVLLVRSTVRVAPWIPGAGGEEASRAALPERLESLAIGWVVARTVGLGLVIAALGWGVTELTVEIASRLRLDQSVAGQYLSAVATSLPELVTAVAAVRRGALSLAIGNVLGGNAFDVLFIAFADVAHLEGPIFAALQPADLGPLALATLLNGVVLLGLLRREERGLGNIGFESVLVLALYVAHGALMLW